MYRKVDDCIVFIRFMFSFRKNYIPEMFYDIRNLFFFSWMDYAWL